MVKRAIHEHILPSVDCKRHWCRYGLAHTVRAPIMGGGCSRAYLCRMSCVLARSRRAQAGLHPLLKGGLDLTQSASDCQMGGLSLGDVLARSMRAQAGLHPLPKGGLDFDTKRKRLSNGGFVPRRRACTLNESASGVTPLSEARAGKGGRIGAGTQWSENGGF